MKQILYYQPDFNKFVSSCAKWDKERITLFTEKQISETEIISFREGEFPFEKKKGELSSFLHNQVSNYSTLIIVVGDEADNIVEVLELIILYPEVNFFFENPNFFENKEEHVTKTKYPYPDYSIVETLSPLDPKSGFGIREILTLDNLFDATNLRFSARNWKFSMLNLSDNNESRVQTRKKNLAIVIDEELEQTNLNCYILYANGFRCLPVSTYAQFESLQLANPERQKWKDYSIIIRDFDLQFPDEVSDQYWARFKNDGNEYKVSTVDYIRGYKLINIKSEVKSEKLRWKDLISEHQQAVRIPGVSSTKEDFKSVINPFWNNNDYQQTEKGNWRKLYIVTQGYENLATNTNADTFKFRKNESKLIVPGLTKPLVGIYFSINKLSSVKKISKRSSTPSGSVSRFRNDRSHSAPLDLYETAFSILERAKAYYSQRKFILASILAQDVIELLNCFHVMLSTQAYHLYAISENAIAMTTIGGSEKSLANDCEIRTRKIKREINHLIEGTEQNPRNILNQIFSDCRLFCKEKEHFESEDVFIRAMAHNNERFSVAVKRLCPFKQ